MPSAATNAAFARMVASFNEPAVTSALQDTSFMSCQPKPSISVSSAVLAKNKRLRSTPAPRTPKHKKASDTADAWARMAADLGVSTSIGHSKPIKPLTQTTRDTFQSSSPESSIKTMATTPTIKGISPAPFIPVEILSNIMEYMDPPTLLKFINNSTDAMSVFRHWPRTFIMTCLKNTRFFFRNMTLNLMLIRHKQKSEGRVCWYPYKKDATVWLELFDVEGQIHLGRSTWKQLAFDQDYENLHVMVAMKRIVDRILDKYPGENNKDPEAILRMLEEVVTTLPIFGCASNPYYERVMIEGKQTDVPIYEVPDPSRWLENSAWHFPMWVERRYKNQACSLQRINA